MNIPWLPVTIAIGALCGFILAKAKIPGGFMIGAIIGVTLLNIISAAVNTTGAAYMPKQIKLLVQIIAGSAIGCTMKKEDLKRLPKLIKPMVIMLGGFLLLNIVAGLLIYAVSPLDLITSLMSAVPGGISDTPIIASDMGADGPKVAVMQTMRLIFGLGIFPSLIMAYGRKSKTKPEPESPMDTPDVREPPVEKTRQAQTRSWMALAVTLAVGAMAGILGKKTAIPAMAFVFPVITALVLKLGFNFAVIPPWLKKCAQVLSGSYLGSTIFMADILELRYLVFPIIIITVGYMLNCFFTGKLIARTCGFSRTESMLVTIPAGASDMVLIAADLGIENPDIMILQVTRLIAVMTIFPQIISLILFIGAR
jgi:membrane AbrB-like protein